MIELYEWPRMRSQRVRWALEELEVEFSSQSVNLMEGEQNSSFYRNIHPLGVVPALKTDAYTMFESSAIVMQLIDEHPDKNLAPDLGSPQRTQYYQWCIFACSECDASLMLYFDNTMRPLEAMRPPGRQHNAELAEIGRAEFALRAKVLSDVLQNQKYLLGAQFSGADIIIGHSCFMANHMSLLNNWPVLDNYYQNLQKRPAHQRAYTEFFNSQS